MFFHKFNGLGGTLRGRTLHPHAQTSICFTTSVKMLTSLCLCFLTYKINPIIPPPKAGYEYALKAAHWKTKGKITGESYSPLTTREGTPVWFSIEKGSSRRVQGKQEHRISSWARADHMGTPQSVEGTEWSFINIASHVLWEIRCLLNFVGRAEPCVWPPPRQLPAQTGYEGLQLGLPKIQEPANGAGSI